MAMTSHKISRTEGAMIALEHVRELSEGRPFVDDRELHALITETEELLAGEQW